MWEQETPVRGCEMPQEYTKIWKTELLCAVKLLPAPVSPCWNQLHGKSSLKPFQEGFKGYEGCGLVVELGVPG